MNRIQELRARLAALKDEGKGIVGDAEASETGEMTAEQEARFNAISAEIDEVQASIDKAEKLAEQRRRMDAIQTAGAGNSGGRINPRPAGEMAVNDLNPERTFGFKDIGEFAVSVRRAARPGGAVDERLMMAAPTNFHSGGGDSGEGFELPPDFRDRIFEVMERSDELGPLVDEETTSRREVKMLADEDTPWSSTGVQANWRAEGTQMSASKLTTQDRSVYLHEIYAFVLATGELLEDAPRMAGRLTRRAGEALSWKKNGCIGTSCGNWPMQGCSPIWFSWAAPACVPVTARSV